ncbi:MAG: glycosyltransferase [Prevotella sp.]|jgi:Glycosyltransferases involved in cell wall biogenesis|nr:glycosyltransferase [Prevotella sp.]
MQKVSILVPVYGVSAYIEVCAHSLFSQTYDNIEFIFVDDCSPDDSIARLQKVLHEYPMRQQQVRIIHHTENKGLGGARETALQAATGEAVMIVDSDDMVPRYAVERLMAALEKEHLDVVTGNYNLYYQGEEKPIQGQLFTSKQQFLRKVLCQNLVKHQVWARLYRRQFLQEQDIHFHPGIDYGEDYSVTPCVFFAAHAGWIPDVVYCYRTDNLNSYTHQISPKNWISNMRSNGVVQAFFRQRDVLRIYAQALDMGLLNLYRGALAADFSPETIQQYCPFLPLKRRNRLFLYAMIHLLPLKWANFMYLVYRRLNVF